MGEAWNGIAPGVRGGLRAPLEAFGTLRVSRAHHGVAGLIARVIALPPEGAAIEARLTVTQVRNGMHWVREFGGWRAESTQTFRNETYIEAAGPWRLAFRVERQGRSLAHIHTGTTVLGFPVPRFLGPTVDGLMEEGPDERSWVLSVDIKHIWFGTICRYEGVMHAK